jgi:hypothetical protein
VPSLAASQHLSQDEIQARIKQEGVQFRAAIAQMKAPAELAGAHQKLLTDLKQLQVTASGPLSVTTLAAMMLIASPAMNRVPEGVKARPVVRQPPLPRHGAPDRGQVLHDRFLPGQTDDGSAPAAQISRRRRLRGQRHCPG